MEIKNKNLARLCEIDKEDLYNKAKSLLEDKEMLMKPYLNVDARKIPDKIKNIHTECVKEYFENSVAYLLKKIQETQSDILVFEHKVTNVCNSVVLHKKYIQILLEKSFENIVKSIGEIHYFNPNPFLILIDNRTPINLIKEREPKPICSQIIFTKKDIFTTGDIGSNANIRISLQDNKIIYQLYWRVYLLSQFQQKVFPLDTIHFTTVEKYDSKMLRLIEEIKKISESY